MPFKTEGTVYTHDNTLCTCFHSHCSQDWAILMRLIWLATPYSLDLTLPYLFSSTEMDSFSKKVQEELKWWKWQRWSGWNPRHQIFYGQSLRNLVPLHKKLLENHDDHAEKSSWFLQLLHPFFCFLFFFNHQLPFTFDTRLVRQF